MLILDVLCQCASESNIEQVLLTNKRWEGGQDLVGIEGIVLFKFLFLGQDNA